AGIGMLFFCIAILLILFSVIEEEKWTALMSLQAIESVLLVTGLLIAAVVSAFSIMRWASTHKTSVQKLCSGFNPVFVAPVKKINQALRSQLRRFVRPIYSKV